MGLITRQFGPNAKGSKLTFTDMDNNLYYLQGLGVSGLTFSANTLTLINPTGGTLSVNLVADTNTFVTGGTYLNGTAIFTNNTGGTFSVTGFTTGNTLQQVLVNSNITNGNNIIMSESDNIIFKYAGFNNNINTESLTSNRTILFPNNNGTVALLSDVQTFTGGTVTGSTFFTNGLSANTISATTYQNLPQDIFVTGGTYTNGEILFKNNSGGSFTVTGLPIGGAGGQVYYFNISNTQTPHREFSPVGTNIVEQSTGVTINSGVTSVISSFLTPLGYPNALTIPAGYWSFYIHAYKDLINASFDVFCEVYTITTGGTETLILTTEGADVQTISPTVSMQLTDGYYSGKTIDVSDKILVKILATNTGQQTNTITFFTEGQSHYSYGITPFSNFNALTCETLSGCTTIIDLESKKVNKNGDTMTGTLILPTISATTYQNLPIDPNTFVTAFTYNNNVFTIKQNNGQPDLTSTINVLTGLTVNGDLITNTISATTFLNVPSFVNMFLGHSSVAPSDSTTYYIGSLQNLTPSTSNRDAWSVITQYNGSITEVSLISNFGGGSSENSTISLHNLSSGTSKTITSTLQYVSGTPVQILYEPLSASTQPAGWSSFLVVFNGPAQSYAGLTGATSTLTSPLIDGSAYASINVITDVAKFGSGTDGPILVEYSLNSGSTWNTAGTTVTPTGSTPYLNSTVTIPTTSSQMLVRFSVNPTGTSGKRLKNVYFNGISSSINNNYTLSSPLTVSSGDKIQIRWITPNWLTNPSGVTNLFNLKLRL